MRAVRINKNIKNPFFEESKESMLFVNSFNDLVRKLTTIERDFDSSAGNVVDLRFYRNYLGEDRLRCIENSDMLESLIDLVDNAKIAFKNFKETGRSEGRNLLLSLQNKSLSLEEINKKA